MPLLGSGLRAVSRSAVSSLLCKCFCLKKESQFSNNQLVENILFQNCVRENQSWTCLELTVGEKAFVMNISRICNYLLLKAAHMHPTNIHSSPQPAKIFALSNRFCHQCHFIIYLNSPCVFPVNGTWWVTLWEMLHYDWKAGGLVITPKLLWKLAFFC